MSIEQPPHLKVMIESSPDRIIIRLVGEVDLGSRDRLITECATQSGHGLPVVVDLAEAAFMDCAGYTSLLLGRNELQKLNGGRLTVSNAVGQPRRLMNLLADIDQTPLEESSQEKVREPTNGREPTTCDTARSR